jgi:SAM-dependent methyltransferase
MPSLDENRKLWDGGYEWSAGGNEWSAAWGGADWQWSVTLWPRIQAYLPVKRVLEIAPGYGRWTSYLADHCEELVGVDLAASCVEACRARFADNSRLSFLQNDGYSLEGVADNSIGFAFSFDSLVHVEADVLSSYVSELGRVLSDDGLAFLHHSNVGAYSAAEQSVGNSHWRGTTVSADLVVAFAKVAGLECSAQELFPWGGQSILGDCISVICRAESSVSAGPRIRVENASFMDEALRAQTLARLYRPMREPATLRELEGVPVS